MYGLTEFQNYITRLNPGCITMYFENLSDQSNPYTDIEIDITPSFRSTKSGNFIYQKITKSFIGTLTGNDHWA